MKLREILELSFEKSLDDMGKEKLLPCGVKSFRNYLKELSCEPVGTGKSGWRYAGNEPETLEMDINESYAKSKGKTQKSNKTAKNKSVQPENKVSAKTENQ